MSPSKILSSLPGIASVVFLGAFLLFGCRASAGTAPAARPEAVISLIRPGQLETVEKVLSESDSANIIWYLREIHGKTLLIGYNEDLAQDPVSETLSAALAPHLISVRSNKSAGSVFEPMECIFYESGAKESQTKEVTRRIAMITELRREKEAWYRLLHSNPWPDVVGAIRAAGYRNFSIFLEEVDGRLYLFGWLEYVGDDFEADSAANARDPASIRWWNETDACQIPPPEVEEGTWGGLREL